jgi:tRNA pseudouridine65 synthase
LLEVLYEDASLLAVLKPAGLLVHRSALDAQETDTLEARARKQFGPGLHLAHRLDKGTSGVLLLAKGAASASLLGEAFRHERIAKTYLGLVRGWPALDEGLVDHPLARDPERPSQGQVLLVSQTRWQVLRRLEWPVSSQPAFATTRGALLQLEPLQGRRHQLRRHCKHMAHPLIGDATHGKGPLNRALAEHFGLTRLWLHAWQLQLAQGPRIVAPPGEDWEPFLPAGLLMQS